MILLNLLLLVVALVGLGGCAAAGYEIVQRGRRLGYPTLPIGHCHGDHPATLRGSLAWLPPTLVSPLSQRRCAFWVVRLGRHKSVFKSFQSAEVFWFEDGSGQMTVDPSQTQVELADPRPFLGHSDWRLGLKPFRDPRTAAFLAAHWVRPESTQTVSEVIFRPGDKLVIWGRATPTGFKAEVIGDSRAELIVGVIVGGCVLIAMVWVMVGILLHAVAALITHLMTHP